MKPTLREHALCMSEWPLVPLEGSTQGGFWMDISLSIVMTDIKILFIFTCNFFFLNFTTGNWKDLMGK